jgi:hypothetical protein
MTNNHHRINSRRKGKDGELEACKVLNAYGYNMRRSQQYSGKGTSYAGGTHDVGDPDIIGDLDGLHIEVKRRNRLDAYGYLSQAARDASNDRIPVVMYRSDNHQWITILSLDSFMDLYQRAYPHPKE